MISSKKMLLLYLEADRIALNRKKGAWKDRLFLIFFPDHIYRFQRHLRFSEYYRNKKTNWLELLFFFYHFSLYRRLGVKLGFSIPLNTFGPGLAIVHHGTIVVNANAKIGANCRIHVCTNIGASGGTDKAPQIGDNVYIAPGVKIYGDIKIAHNVALAANAVVHHDITEEYMAYGGIPAKKIGPVDIKSLIKHL